MRKTTPEIRITPANNAAPNPDGAFVLYWMIANRRTASNFSLQHAIDWCRELDKPLVVLEALRYGYQWASDRIHQFIIDGMQDNQRSLKGFNVTYYPFLETRENSGNGLLEALSEHAVVVVTDDFPCFFLPRMVASVARRLNVQFDKVDSNGIFPMYAADKVFARAYDFRRFLQKNLRPHLYDTPKRNPFAGDTLPTPCRIPEQILNKWPKANLDEYDGSSASLEKFPINHEVQVVERISGGAEAGEKRLKLFLSKRIVDYVDLRNQPLQDVTSGLSPYLHFGHVSAHDIFSQLMAEEEWSPTDLSDFARGRSSGWWGCSPAAESFLDELITWREIGYNMCFHRDDYDQYESLPEWAKITLAEHASDTRQHVYDLTEFENAETHNDLWNAAQRQLVREGRIHNYLRMVWGKKILEWSESPQSALEIMIELNNKYALDGRNPNSYSGIFWVLGRYDRAWGPERGIFGKIRYMSCDNTARKIKVREYIDKYSSI